MAYPDIDSDLDKASIAMLKEVKKFATGTMRPAGTELDNLFEPAHVIGKSSPMWGIVSGLRGLELHLDGLPPDLGGAGDMPPMARVAFLEQLGYADPGLAMGYLSSNLVYKAAASVNTPGFKKIVKEYCKDTGTKMAGAWAVPGSGRPLGVLAEKKGKHYVLNGEIPSAPNAGFATHAALFVDVAPDDMTRAFTIVPLDAKGLARKDPQNKMGLRSLNQGGLVLTDVKVLSGLVFINKEKNGATLADRLVAGARRDISAIFSGLAMASLDEAVGYSHKRVQGGVPIFEHNNIKSKLFDMFTRVEAVRANVRRLARYDAQNPGTPSPAHAAAAKCLATETAAYVASEAMQVFGGNGLAREYPLEKFFRDARSGMLDNGVNEDLALVASGEL